ncbi:hypothetical protein D9M68_900590 [compost metagenome]
MHGKHGDAIARGEVEVAHGAVAVARVTPDDGLGHDHIMAADGLEGLAAVEGELVALPQVDHVLDLAVQDQQVAGRQCRVMARLGDFQLVAEDFQHLQATAAVEVGLADGAADHR